MNKRLAVQAHAQGRKLCQSTEQRERSRRVQKEIAERRKRDPELARLAAERWRT